MQKSIFSGNFRGKKEKNRVKTQFSSYLAERKGFEPLMGY